MQVFKLSKRDLAPESLGFSPNGRLLAAWDQGQVSVIDTTSGAARTIWSERDEICYGVPGIGFTADSKSVIALHNRYEGVNPIGIVQVHHAETGKVRRKFSAGDARAMDVAPGGSVVLAVRPIEKTANDQVMIWNPADGKSRTAFSRTRGFFQQLAVSPDGHWIAESCVDEIRVWNVAGEKSVGRAKRQFKSDRNRTTRALAVSADGEYVAATSELSVRVWDVRTGKPVLVEKCSAGQDREVAFHPSRPLLAYSGGPDEVVFWDAKARAETNRFAWEIGTVSSLAFSHDGLRCAAAGKGKVVIWDVDA